jgi:hypothetical protein
MKKLMLLLLFVVGLVGCNSETKYTKEEWLKVQPPPVTVEEGKAQAVLQSELNKSQQEVKELATMGWVKLFCIIGFLGSIAAIVLGTQGIKMFGIAGLVTSISGYALTYFFTRFPLVVAGLGAAIAIPTAGYAMYIVIRAMREVVKTVQLTKEKLPEQDRDKLFGDMGVIPNLVQSVSTEAIVKKIKDAL